MIETVITASILIAVVVLVRALFWGKIGRRFQYALWGLVLLRLCLPFSLVSSPVSVMNMMHPTVADPVVGYVGYDVPDLAVAEPGPSATEEEIQAAREEWRVQMDAAKAETGTPVALSDVLRYVWLAGSAAVCAWFAVTNIACAAKLRRRRVPFEAADSRLPVFVVDGLASPCLFGLFRPAVYLTPAAAENADTVRHVLAHETAHYRHLDHIWPLLRGLCLIVYWWNPLVWAAAILSRTDSELACDEAVLKRLGRENRFDYGRTLVDMIDRSRKAGNLICAATTMASGKKGVRKRLNMIVKNPKTLIPALAAVLIIVALCVGCTFTGAADGADLEPGIYATADGSAWVKLDSDGTFVFNRNSATSYDPVGIYMVDGNTVTFHAADDEEYTFEVEGGDLVFKSDTGVQAIVQVGTVFSRDNSTLTPEPGDIESPAEPTDEPAEEPEAVKTNLDACVSEAIIANSADSFNGGDFAAEAHTTFKIVEEENTVTVYAMALCVEFVYRDCVLAESGGCHMPVAITFEKDVDGTYSLIEYWIPQDGSFYAPSIREKFPEDIADEAMDTQTYIYPHMIACYEQAIAHFNADTSNEPARLLEAICSSPAYSSNPQDYIDEHPIEYRTMVYYGDYTLKYCFTLFEQGGQTGLAGHIMAAVCRDIMGFKGEALLTDQYANGQDWYDVFKQNALSLQNQYGENDLKALYPVSWLLLSMLQ